MDTCSKYSTEYLLENVYNVIDIHYEPKYCDFGKKSERLKCFNEKNWNKNYPVSKLDLVDAGFFIWKNENNIENLKDKQFACCFYCGVLIYDWEIEDNPWIEHAKHNPKCNYIKLNKDFVEKYTKQYTSDAKKIVNIWYDSDIVQELFSFEFPFSMIKQSLFERYEEKKMMFESLDEAINLTEKCQLKQVKLISEHFQCKFCLEDEISIVYLPCGHLVTCSFCALGFANCPQCKTTIKGVVKTKLN